MARHGFRLPLGQIGEQLNQGGGGAGVQVAPRAAEQRIVGRVLDQRVFENQRALALGGLDKT